MNLPAPAAPILADACVTPLPALASILCTGADAAAFLHSQLSSDVKALPPGHGQYSSYNSPKGRMLATLVVWRSGDDYRLIIATDLAEAIRKRLAMFVLRSKAALAIETPTLMGIYGARAAAIVGAVAGSVPAPWASVALANASVLALPDGRFLVAAGESLAAWPGAVAGTEAAWQWQGIHAGVPWVTAATSDQLIAQSANWELVGGVDFRKGCYPGQEIVARMQYLGKLKERLHVFHATATSVAAGDALRGPGSDETAGTVVNAVAAPGGGTDLLAVVKHSAIAAGPVMLATDPASALVPIALPYAVPVIENVRVRL